MSAQRALIQRFMGDPLQAGPTHTHMETGAETPALVAQRVVDEDKLREILDEVYIYYADINFSRSPSQEASIDLKAKSLNKGRIKAGDLKQQLKDWIKQEHDERVAARQQSPSQVPSSSPVDASGDVNVTSSSSSSSTEHDVGFPDSDGKEEVSTSSVPTKKSGKRNRFRPLTDADLHDSSTATGPWGGSLPSSVMSGANVPLVSSSSSSSASMNNDKRDSAITAIKNYMPSQGHGGMNVKVLTAAQVRQVITAGEGLKTSGGNQKYAIIRGPGSGDFAGKWQVKFISYVETGHSNATYHLTVSKTVYDQLTEVPFGQG